MFVTLVLLALCEILLGANVGPSPPRLPSMQDFRLQRAEKDRVLVAISAMPSYYIPKAHSASPIIKYKVKQIPNKRKRPNYSSRNVTGIRAPKTPSQKPKRPNDKPILKPAQLISIAKLHVSPHFPTYLLNVTRR
jgi:hypothetical protein